MVTQETPDQKHILIVEDEPAILSLLSDILTHSGYSVIKSTNGEEALSIYQKKHDQIAIVILDMNMPGIGGKEAFLEMKKINPSVCALISTGYSKNDMIQDILREGVKGYIQKPFNMQDLLKLIKNFISIEPNR
jgi:DNA-binding NtrC family response regulator